MRPGGGPAVSEVASPPSGAATPEHERRARHRAGRRTRSVPPTSTSAGSLLGGRYRLIARVGSDTAAGAEFWRAEDTVLQRDVAVTVLRRLAPEGGAIGGDADPTGTARAGEMLVRALRTGSFEHPGCARLLDVLAPGASGVPDDVLGAAVTEWVPGRSLAETVADGLIKPFAAARAVVPLAAAAEEAHRHGLVLGCDHPQRVRVNPDGNAQMCFALPRPDLRARRRRPRPRRRPLRPAHVALAAVGRRRRPRGPRRGRARRRRRAPPRPRSGPACPSSWMRSSPGRSARSAAPGTCTPPRRSTGCSTRSWPRTTASRCSRPSPTASRPAPATCGRTAAAPTPRAIPTRRRKLLVGLAGLAIAVLSVLGFVGVEGGLALRRRPRRAGDRGRQRRAARPSRARPPPRRRPPRRGARRSRSPGSRSTTPPAIPTTQAGCRASSTATSAPTGAPSSTASSSRRSSRASGSWCRSRRRCSSRRCRSSRRARAR